MYENNIGSVKVKNDVNCLFHFKSGVKNGCVLSAFYMDHFDGLYPKEHSKGNRRKRERLRK